MYGEKQRLNESFLMCGVLAAVVTIVGYVYFDSQDERLAQRRATFHREAPMTSLSHDGKVLTVANAVLTCKKAIPVPQEKVGELLVLGRKYVLTRKGNRPYRRKPTDIVFLIDHDKNVVSRFSALGCKVQKTREVEW